MQFITDGFRSFVHSFWLFLSPDARAHFNVYFKVNQTYETDPELDYSEGYYLTLKIFKTH
jgi:hypothetical protein